MRCEWFISGLLLGTGSLLFDAGLSAQACYELVWSEEFNEAGLPDSTVWSHEVGGGGWGNNELQYYTDRSAGNARVEQGNLIIEARKEDQDGSSYTSARLITYQNGLSFRYGRIETRMKLPYGQGIWPAFWMLGDGIFEGTAWPACGEIDIMEMIGGGTGRDDVVHGTIHWSDASGNHAEYGGQKQLAEGIFADSFHLFSIEWNETTIRWFLDGVQYHVVDITPGHMSEFHRDFFILLNVAVGGNWPGYPDASTIFPQRLFVDYIRVYQLNSAPVIKGDTMAVAAVKGIRFATVESGDFTYAWSVPADAEIIEGQGTPSIVVDWGCDSGTVSCDVSALCGSYSLKHKVNLQQPEISGKDRVEAGEANLVYSIPGTREASYDWSLPEGVSLQSEPDTNSIAVDWGDTGGEIVLHLSDYCGSDTVSKSISVVRQLPYPDPDQPKNIPGTIASVHYDTGGEGIAYHDTEPENLGSGSRQDEGVDTEPNDGGENIGWLAAGEWLEYTIEVEKTGLYDAGIRVASTNSNGRFTLLFDGEERTGTVSVPGTGSWSSFTTITVSDIPLKDTDQRMRILIVNGLFNMGRLVFREAPATRTGDAEGTGKVLIYPTVASESIFVKNTISARQYSMIDQLGRTVGKGMIHPEGHIPVYELDPGLYYLFLHNGKETVAVGRFFKTD